MADVARLAGVSHQTVSRVLNDGVVAESTRKRVLEAIRMLGYRPNSAARALVTGRSRTVGVICFDPTLHGQASTLIGVEHAAREEDYFTSVVSLRSLDRRGLLDAIHRLERQGVEGIVATVPQLSAINVLPALHVETPLVAVEAGPDAGFPVAAIDQEAGGAAATRHLLELGHETVVHLAGPSGWDEAERRLNSWRAVITEAGAQFSEPLRGDWSPSSGYELGKKLIKTRGVTAVFVANDQMALGLLRAIHEAGLRVPDDISIVGFDDIPEAPYFSPPLTTVRQPFAEMGRCGFQLLRDEIENGMRSDRRVCIQPELVLRASTARR
jgi:DNA-binding LacI/PurR family transcriptional regulator